VCVAGSAAYAGPLLPFPNANQLSGPAFLQPFAFVTVGAGGQASPFFSDLPDGAFGPDNTVFNLLGNFKAFDSLGNPVASFDILGAQVTFGGHTFAPQFGLFDFAGNPSLTL